MNSLARKEQLIVKAFIAPDGRRALGLFLVQATPAGISAQLVSVRFLDADSKKQQSFLLGGKVLEIDTHNKCFVCSRIVSPYVSVFSLLSQPTRGPTSYAFL
ncbi:MAG: hypothetical protein WDZ88_01220 [Candidatus Paceibacterota bacterium]